MITLSPPLSCHKTIEDEYCLNILFRVSTRFTQVYFWQILNTHSCSKRIFLYIFHQFLAFRYFKISLYNLYLLGVHVCNDMQYLCAGLQG